MAISRKEVAALKLKSVQDLNAELLEYKARALRFQYDYPAATTSAYTYVNQIEKELARREKNQKVLAL